MVSVRASRAFELRSFLVWPSIFILTETDAHQYSSFKRSCFIVIINMYIVLWAAHKVLQGVLYSFKFLLSSNLRSDFSCYSFWIHKLIYHPDNTHILSFHSISGNCSLYARFFPWIVSFKIFMKGLSLWLL